MVKTKILKISLILALAVLIALIFLIVSPAEAEAAVETIITDTSTIVFDMAKANVEISNTTYKGYGYVYKDGKWTYGSISGTHDPSNKYYVYQSNGDEYKAVDEGDSLKLPVYRYGINDSIFVNNTDIEKVISDWESAAILAGRAASNYRIDISCAGVDCELTIENLWSSYQNSTPGAINISGALTTDTNITINLKGDNRFHNIRYYTTKNDAATTSSLTFNSASGNGSLEGSLVVIGKQAASVSAAQGFYRFPNEGGGYTEGKSPYNTWQSVIGGLDDTTREDARGLKILGGTIYAGATKWENCSAIGGGGNGITTIAITGGSVTAVASTTGAAIGGGIAHTGSGGAGYVDISGGEVYAYNFGLPYAEVASNSGLTGMKNSTGEDVIFIPGTAIGGGSSGYNAGSYGNISISGGYVYAYSNGGSGIGGGNTVGNKNNKNTTGGKANVEISGGEVHSISGSYHIDTVKADGTAVNTVIHSGTGIGGGTSVNQNGGLGDVIISGGIIDATGIGGGGSTYKDGGDAHVTVTGGTTAADNIGGGFSETNGYSRGVVEITGGSLNSMLAIIPTNGDENVYLTRVASQKDGNASLNTEVSSLRLKSGNTLYGLKDVYTDKDGVLYLWLPENDAVLSVTENIAGSDIELEAFDELDGEINSKDIGLIRNDDGVDHYMVNVILAPFYEIYHKDGVTPFNTAVFVEQNSEFTYLVNVNKDENGEYYTVQPYVAVTDSNGNMTFQKSGTLDSVSDGKYKRTVTIDKNTQIWFEVTDSKGNRTFVIDWASGDINITKDPNVGIVIEQNGYRLEGFDGDVYVTTGGFPSANSINVDCEDREFDLYLDKINIATDKNSAISVKTGNVNLNISEYDNAISTHGGVPAISLGEKGKITIDTTGKESLKIDSVGQTPAISGTGTLVLNDEGGYLDLNKGNSTSGTAPQISVGTYEYNGSKAEYTAQLNNGEFSFDLIGYISQSGDLYDKTEMDADNKDNFYARGVRKVFTTTVNETIPIDDIYIKNGKYIVKVNATGTDQKMGDIVVVKSDGTPVDPSYYSYNEATGELTVEKEAFVDGNIFVYAATEGEIPYEAHNRTYEYDGTGHEILIIVDTNRFNVYYSLTPITVKPTDASLLNGIKRDQAGATTVYYYISAKDGIEGNYQDVYGSCTITVTEAENSFIGRLICQDVLLGNTPNPRLTSKWGEVKFKYYTKSGDVYTEVDDISVIGTHVGDVYYVKAYVDKSVSADTPTLLNYDAIETDYYIRFTVFETNVFASPDKVLHKITTPPQVIKMPANGAFTVYYETTYKTDMQLSFNVALPIGTKITFIDFSDEDKILVYYYQVDGNVINADSTDIPLGNFILMGDETKFYEGVAVNDRVCYQFCIEADAMNLSNMKLSFSDMDVITVEPLLATDAYFSGSVDDMTDTVGTVRIPLSVYSEGAPYAGQHNILSVRVNNAPDGMYIALERNSIITPAVRVDDIFIFDLGSLDIPSVTYTLILDNLVDATEYTVSADIRIRDRDKISYPLTGEKANNHMDIDVTFNQAGNIYPSIVGDKVIPTDTRELYVRVSSIERELDKMSVFIYKKDEQGTYVKYAAARFVRDEASGDLIISFGNSSLPEGSYMLELELNGKVGAEYFIVQ